MKNVEIHSERADIETSSKEYGKRFSGEIGQFFLNTQTKHLFELLGDNHDLTILDVGGGHAQIAMPLVRNGYDVTVVGSSPKCRERLAELLKPGSYRYQTCNLLQLPFAENSFDVAIAFRLLTHEKNWKLQLVEMCRVAKRMVIVDYPDLRSFNILYNQLFRFKKAYEKDTRPYKSFSRKELVMVLNDNHFGNPVPKPQFFLPMVLHRKMKNVFLSRFFEQFFSLVGLNELFGSPVILKVTSLYLNLIT